MFLRYRLATAFAALAFVATGARAQVLTEPVGTTSPVQTATVTVTTAGTLGAINVLTQGAPNLDFNFVSGGTCTLGTAYAANATCTVKYTFTPTYPGARNGGITLTSGNTLLATAYISGAGTGPRVNFPPGILSKVASGFNQPGGMAFDGSGNLFVADNSDGRVMELIAATGYTTSTAISTGITQPYIVALDGVGNLFYTDDFSVIELYAVGGYKTSVTLDSFGYHPDSIAVDGNGNVFVTDNGNLIEILAAGGYSTIITRPAGYFGCLAIDSSGNVFVASFYLSQMKEFFAASGYTTTITFPLTIPYVASIAVDDNNNVFAIDNNDSTLRELFASSGYTTQAIFSLPSLPGAMALDATGNVFFSDSTIRGVYKLDFADPPTFTFATTPVGQTSTDSPQTVTLLNSGNAPLIFSTPVAGINPSISAGFTLGNSSTCPQLSTSSAPATLTVGASCTDVVSFHPVAQGAINGQLITTDNALNATGATEIVPLGGTGSPAATVSTLTVSPSPAQIGTAVTLTANVAPNPASTSTPTGTVNFYDGTVLIGTAPLLANGVATLVSTLSAGNNNLSCVYSGDSNFATSMCAPVVEDILTAQTITFRQPASPAYAGTSVLLNATSSSGLAVVYSVISGPATVNGSVLHYSGAGTVVVEADQPGNASYSAAQPVQVTITPILLSVPVGTQSAVVTTLVSITTAGQLSAINVMTQGTANLDFNFATGGTCSAGTNYIVGQTCTVSFTFKPTHPGVRYGGISLVTSGSVVLGNAYVYGLGTGPQVTYSPASQSLLGGYYSYPTGVAVDGIGDVFLSDGSGNSVSEVPVSTGVSQLLGTFAAPDDVAVDGSGNVFVIYNRSALAEIMAVNGVIPVAPTINVISTNFAGLNGMKVDGNGNIYLAASFFDGSGSMIQEVLAVNGSIPANPTVLTLVSGVGGPTGVAIDSAGNVYFSDEIGNAAWEAKAVNGVIPPSPTVVQLTANLTEPSNIAVDAAGNVFVSELGSIAQIVAVNGIIPANPTVLNLGTGLIFPQGLAVDASGNIFVSDDGTPQAVKLDYADAPSLSFATTEVGFTSTDSPQTVTLGNDGNANLTWSSIPVTTNPTITAGFTFSSTCPVIASGTALAYSVTPGGSCAESISFTPVTAGLDTGKFTLTDNNLNVPSAQQNILLNGTGTIATTSIGLTLTPNPMFALQTFSATVTLTLNSAGGPPDPGQPVTLTYNPGTGPVVINLTTDANGNATYNFPGLNTGSYLISANFAGNGGQKPVSISNTEVVNPFPTTSVLTVTPAAPVSTDNVVLNVAVTAPIAPSLPTGTVTFFNGATVLGTVALNGSAVAQLAIGTLPAGSYTFTCQYSGTQNFAPSACAPVTVTVIPPPDFSLTANPPSITIETQHHKTMPLTLTAIGSFSGPVYLSCQAPLPAYLTCELPVSETLSVGQAKAFNFTMDTDELLNFLATSSPASRSLWTATPARMALALLLPLVLAGFARRRKMLRGLLLLAVLAVGATGLTACGNKWPRHTPPGTYTIPVVGTGTAPNGTVITHTLNITLTVTP